MPSKSQTNHVQKTNILKIAQNWCVLALFKFQTQIFLSFLFFSQENFFPRQSFGVVIISFVYLVLYAFFQCWLTTKYEEPDFWVVRYNHLLFNQQVDVMMNAEIVDAKKATERDRESLQHLATKHMQNFQVR